MSEDKMQEIEKLIDENVDAAAQGKLVPMENLERVMNVIGRPQPGEHEAVKVSQTNCRIPLNSYPVYLPAFCWISLYSEIWRWPCRGLLVRMWERLYRRRKDFICDDLAEFAKKTHFGQMKIFVLRMLVIIPRDARHSLARLLPLSEKADVSSLERLDPFEEEIHRTEYDEACFNMFGRHLVHHAICAESFAEQVKGRFK